MLTGMESLCNQSPRRQSASQWIMALNAVLFLNVVALAVAWGLDFGAVDDSLISFRYAQNLAAGHGLVFNPGTRVEGYSNLLWTLQLAAIARLGGDLERWATLLAVISTLATTVLLTLAVGRLSPSPRAIPLLLAGGIFASLSPPLLFYGLCGLETAQHTALVTAAVSAAALARRTWSLAAGVICAALVSISRPEGIAITAVVLVALALRRDLPRGRRAAVIVATLLTSTVVFGGHLLWRRAYYGQWLPNVFYAKVDVSRPSVLVTGAAYCLEFMIGTLLLVWILPWWRQRREQPVAWTAAVLLLLCVQAGLALLAGGDWMPLSRFLVPAWPVLIAAMVPAWAAIAENVRFSGGVEAGTRLIAVAVCAALASAGFFYRMEFKSLKTNNSANREFKLIGRWLARQADRGQSLAATTMGAIPYYSDLISYDFLGLTEPDVAQGATRSENLPPGHRKISGTPILTKEPTYIVAWSKTWAVPPTEAHFAVERVGFPGLWDLYRQREFNQNYRYAVVCLTQPPEPAIFLALYVRRGVPLRDEVQPWDMDRLRREMARAGLGQD